MWLYILFIVLFFIGAIAFFLRMTSGKAIKTAKSLLENNSEDILAMETTINHLNIINSRDVVDECKELAKQLRARINIVKANKELGLTSEVKTDGNPDADSFDRLAEIINKNKSV